MIGFIKIFATVAIIIRLCKTKFGQKLGNFFPTPFWIYFIPMILNTFGFFTKSSAPGIDFIYQKFLPAALVLLLIETPIDSLFKLGSQATKAMVLGSISVTIAVIASFLALVKFFPVDSYKGAASLLATWVGGSANMIAVQGALNLSDKGLAPLVIVDTILSYSWMALLIIGAGYQENFDKNSFSDKETNSPLIKTEKEKSKLTKLPSMIQLFIVLSFGFFIGEVCNLTGKFFYLYSNLLPSRIWTILLATTIAVALASTQVRKIEALNASKVGGFLLYMVLATVGSKASFDAIFDTPIFFVFGILVFIIHGLIHFYLGKKLRIKLFLLSTASQANIGGPISAPIVAAIYKPGTAQFGVIMGIMGNVIGTYVGLFGAAVCHHIEVLFK